MPNYTDAAELAADQQFQDWCHNPDAEGVVDWNAWSIEQPNRSELVSEARKLVLALSLQPDASATQAAYRSVRLKIARRRSARRNTRLAYAATFAILVAALGAWWSINNVAETVYATVKTTNDEITPIVLPDGTTINLNANSSLRYAEDFLAGDTREAWLEGEGYFDVTPSTEVEGRPFTLHTDAGNIAVVGTAFNVRLREDIFEVVLTEGKVQIEDLLNNETITLLPGERAISRGETPLRIEDVETEAFTAWQRRELLFRDMPLSRVVERLRYDYQLNLNIPDNRLLQKRVSANIKNGDPFALTLALASIYELGMEVNADSTIITLTPR